MHRHRCLWSVVLAVSLAAISLACGPAPNTQSTPSAGNPEDGKQPTAGGVFHIPVTGNNPNLNPYNMRGSPENLSKTLYESLVFRDLKAGVNWFEHQRLAPGLAERWERPDDRTYVFHLRKNVTWHDGKPFIAADVVHTLDHLKQQKGKVNDSARVLGIASVEAPDSHTVRITTTNPNPEFLRDDVLNIEITPKHVAEAGGELETQAVGTGPFTLKDFDTASGWRVARNPSYWNAGLPYLDGVVGHYMSDRGTMMAAFNASNLDVMNPEDKVQLDTIQGLTGGISQEKFYGTYGYGLYFAMDAPPFDDVRVRRAINLAADRQDMLVKASFGDGIINPPGVYGWKTGWAIPPEELLKLPGYNPETKQKDNAEARRLLSEAGHTNGLSVTVSLSAASTNPKPIAEVLASQLKPLGINVTLKPLDRGTLAKTEREEDWQAHILGISGESRSELYDRLHSKGILNKHGPKDPQLDTLLDQLLVEFDESKAQKLHQQIQRRMYDQAYFIGAFERGSYTIYQPWVHGVLNNYGANIIPFWGPPTAWMDLDRMPENRRTEQP